MLDAFQRAGLSIRYILSLIFILKASSGLFASEPCPPQICAAHSYFDYFTQYFGSINENADVDEVIDNLVMMRQAMLNQGIECPMLRQLCRDMLKYLIGHSVDVGSDALREFVEKVEQRELECLGRAGRPQVHVVRHHHHRHENKKKDTKLGSKSIFGFVKVLAGALTTLLPIPGAQVVGLALIGLGVNEIIDDTREQGDINEKLQERDEQRRREEELLKEPVLP